MGTLPVTEAMIDASVHRNGTADSVGIGQETIEDVRFRDMLSKSQSVPPDVFANPNSSISPCPQEPLASTDAEVVKIGRTEVGRSKSSLMRQKSPKRGASASPPRASRLQAAPFDPRPIIFVCFQLLLGTKGSGAISLYQGEPCGPTHRSILSYSTRESTVQSCALDMNSHTKRKT